MLQATEAETKEDREIICEEVFCDITGQLDFIAKGTIFNIEVACDQARRVACAPHCFGSHALKHSLCWQWYSCLQQLLLALLFMLQHIIVSIRSKAPLMLPSSAINSALTLRCSCAGGADWLLPSLSTERLGIQQPGQVCFFEVLAPYYYKVDALLPPLPSLMLQQGHHRQSGQPPWTAPTAAGSCHTAMH
jgi:hypothetical protein